MRIRRSPDIVLSVRACAQEEQQTAGPLVLLLHGLGVGSGYFDLPSPGYSTMDYLVSRGLVPYALDQRGYGRSSKISGISLTAVRAADDVEAVLLHITKRYPGRPVALVGHSWGGMVAMLVCAAGRIPIAALICISMPFRRIREGFLERLDFLEHAGPVEDGWVPNVTPGSLDPTSHEYEPGVLSDYRRLVTRHYPQIPLGILADCRTLPHAEAASRISVPTLVMFGDGDSVVDPMDMLELLAALPTRHRELVALGGGGHLLTLERPHHARVDRTVADWIWDHARGPAAPGAAGPRP